MTLPQALRRLMEDSSLRMPEPGAAQVGVSPER